MCYEEGRCPASLSEALPGSRQWAARVLRRMTSVRRRTWGTRGHRGGRGTGEGDKNGRGREGGREGWGDRYNGILHSTMLWVQGYIEVRLGGMGSESMFYSGL